MGVALGLGSSPKFWSPPLIFLQTAEASEFKFGKHLGFAKAHHKITPRGKRGCGPKLVEHPKILGFPFNIPATAEASDFKFGMQLGFAKAHHKLHPEEKVGVALG